MPNTPRQSTPLVLGATLASLLLVSGCSTINDALGGDKVDYRTSGAKTVRLDVPPDLSQLPGQVRYNQLPAASISAPASTKAIALRASGAELGACSIIIAKLGQYGIIVAAKLWWRRIHARPAMRKAKSSDGD